MRKCIILTSFIMSVSLVAFLALIITIKNFHELFSLENLSIYFGAIGVFFIIFLIPNTLIGLPFLVFVQAKKISSIFAFISAGAVFSALLCLYFYPVFDSAHFNVERKSSAYIFIQATITFGILNCILLWWFAIKKGLLK